MRGADMLQHAARIVDGKRDEYGEPEELFEQIAIRWSFVLKINITSAQVALCFLEIKMARLAHDPKHEDSLVDVAGYAACLQEINNINA